MTIRLPLSHLYSFQLSAAMITSTFAAIAAFLMVKILVAGILLKSPVTFIVFAPPRSFIVTLLPLSTTRISMEEIVRAERSAFTLVNLRVVPFSVPEPSIVTPAITGVFGMSYSSIVAEPTGVASPVAASPPALTSETALRPSSPISLISATSTLLTPVVSSIRPPPRTWATLPPFISMIAFLTWQTPPSAFPPP